MFAIPDLFIYIYIYFFKSQWEIHNLRNLEGIAHEKPSLHFHVNWRNWEQLVLSCWTQPSLSACVSQCPRFPFFPIVI